MNSWSNWKHIATKRLMAPVLAVALIASFGTYELAKPASATAAVVGTAAPALDNDSINSLLALDHAMEALAAHVTPSVVNVTVVSRAKTEVAENMPDDMQRFFGQFFGGGRGMRMQPQPRVEHGSGSGVVISPDGYIVTNNHVVQDATDVRVTMNDRRVLPAKVVGTDPLTDLAVIKIDATNLPSIGWADSTGLRPGQTVLAFGNPYGMRFSVTRGIVSAVNRSNPYSDDPHKPGEFIQTDAAINPGNSGGPLVDARGEVVGINTFLISPSGTFSGMAFAIPSEIAKPTVATLIRDGKVRHAHLGVGVTDVTPENATFFQLKDNSGAVVTQVEANSPGAKAGLQIGDVITELDGKAVRDAGQLQVVVGQKTPGARISLRVLRDGKSLSLPVTLEEMGSRTVADATSSTDHGKARWGIGLTDMTPELRSQLQAPEDAKGAVVAKVEPGSPADNAGLTEGDVVLEVDRHKVASAADVQRTLGNVPKGHDALLLIWSKGGNTFRVLHAPEAA